jgi:ketosteroid isomerase-like protein
MKSAARRIVAVLILLFAGACTTSTSAPPVGTTITTFSSSTPSDSTATASPSPALPRLTEAQARATAVVVAFLDAYNAGDISGAAQLLEDDIVVSDCDYRTHQTLTISGKDQATAWLRAKALDHDKFVGLEDLAFGSPNSIGQFAVAVSYGQRTSDTLRSLGFAAGVKPKFAIKAALSPAGDHLRAWVAETCAEN